MTAHVSAPEGESVSQNAAQNAAAQNAAAQNAAENSSLAAGDRPGSGTRFLLGIGGVLTAILGVIVLAHPLATGALALRLIALLVALYTLVIGIIYIVSAISERDRSGWRRVGAAALGALFIAGGVVLACNLLAVEAVLPVLISITVGVLWLVEGIAVLAVVGQQTESRGWRIFSGVISILAGISLLLAPLSGIATLWWLTGIAMVVLGIVQAVRSFSKQPAA